MDGGGAEYRLDRWNATARTWTSKELFLTYEEDTKRLRMNDGTFWVMNAEASEGEEDAGTRYPTLMQDTNGNQIRIDYGHAAPKGEKCTLRTVWASSGLLAVR